MFIIIFPAPELRAPGSLHQQQGMHQSHRCCVCMKSTTPSFFPPFLNKAPMKEANMHTDEKRDQEIFISNCARTKFSAAINSCHFVYTKSWLRDGAHDLVPRRARGKIRDIRLLNSEKIMKGNG
ncbi:hypothetical protein [Herminiimonas sp. KBW02]|uniref:hypothetical protein n=1 Tax=Herminiimonas sp. KBW02 TaxID=2153363 RepID=UPI000F5B5009|nr:hypothetical protein [Herminiimonas sp. KBW02]